MKISESPQVNFGQRKVPRYIYHFTNEKAYKSILEDGFIKVSENDPYIEKDGVFAVELSNLLHFWGKHKDWGNESDEALSKSLFRAVASWRKLIDESKSNLVVLRIPTDQLDLKKLSTRSQHVFFKYKYSDPKPKIHTLPDRIRENLQGLTNVTSDETRKQRKHKAMEYIYFDNISNFQRVGEIVNIPKIRNTEEFMKYPVRTILSHLFKGTPEENGVNFLEI